MIGLDSVVCKTSIQRYCYTTSIQRLLYNVYTTFVTQRLYDVHTTSIQRLLQDVHITLQLQSNCNGKTNIITSNQSCLAAVEQLLTHMRLGDVAVQTLLPISYQTLNRRWLNVVIFWSQHLYNVYPTVCGHKDYCHFSLETLAHVT